MENYLLPNKKLWKGRTSNGRLYLHEKVQCTSLEEISKVSDKSVAILGYGCDTGVERNQGRIGAKDGPDAIRRSFSRMPNHLTNKVKLYDVGNVICSKGNMESAQDTLAFAVASILEKKHLPIVLGGGHDLAYGHYQGINGFLRKGKKDQNIGIINFDAHFDLRKPIHSANSGTPFFQIATECKEQGKKFNYLCMGIRKDANDRSLFETAKEFEVMYVLSDTFRIQFLDEINTYINAFAKTVDWLYVTIDLDGFSSAYAPGVSASSPMGFTPQIVLECLKTIISTQKLISIDIAEMNPKYDVDDQTAKLAASLLHTVVHSFHQV